jgi:aromatic-L-amino-acid decarboxylase
LYQRQHPDAKLEDLIIYTTTQTHSLGAKAALVLGLHFRSIKVSAKDGFALRGDSLRTALRDDIKNGRKPFVLSGFLSFHDMTLMQD